MKVNVYNQKAEVVGEMELNSKVFEVKANQHLLAESVRVFLANARKGLAHTKTRGEVRGGGKKPWKQKGTGRARVGSIRSPIWRKGGITFGPRSNRNWSLKMNKQSARQALFMALSDKAKEGKLFVIENFKMEKPKTKEFAGMLENFKNMGLGKKQLFVIPSSEKNFARSSRNIPSINPISADSINTYEILRADSIIALKDSISIIEKTYLKK